MVDVGDDGKIADFGLIGHNTETSVGKSTREPVAGIRRGSPADTEPQILRSRYLLSRPADSLLIRSPALWTIWSRDWYRTG